MSETSSITLTIAKLVEALSKAQGEFPVIPKDSEVEVRNKEGRFLYKYKYADLTTIINCTRPALSKHGLSFTQDLVKREGFGSGFSTIIYHSSGERLETGFVPCNIPTHSDMKLLAGLYTYGKRISLTAALGVSADEDMDSGPNEGLEGNVTSKASAKPPERRPINHAPGGDGDEFDQYMQEPPPDDMNLSLRDQFKFIVKQRGISAEEGKKIIKLATGRDALSVELSDEELANVLSYIKMKS